jgi:putative membrane protein
MTMVTEANKALERKMNIAAYIISAVVLLLVGAMRRLPKLDLGIDFSFLPPVHALLNGAAAVLLIAALYFIKNKNMQAHRNMIYGALACSALFLVCYVLYHSTTSEIIYGDINHSGSLDDIERAAVAGTRPWYLVLLLTHIVLAGGILPFILLTFNRAFTAQYDRHKKMARWVYPLWLYVAVTGPLCYLMLKPYY